MKENTYVKWKVLAIDSDEESCKYYRRIFTKNGYKVVCTSEGKKGLDFSANLCPDLVIVDLKLADVNGFELIQAIRKQSDCFIIVVTEENRLAYQIRALRLGADDYIQKPYHVEELLVRMETCLRRRTRQSGKRFYQTGNLCIDFDKRMVTLSGKQIHLAPTEYRIMEYLAVNAGKVITYRMILKKLWGIYASEDNRILRVNITNIRRKIEPDPSNPIYIITETRVGYRMLENECQRLPEEAAIS